MIYIDMDGTLARWNPEATDEEIHQPEYYLERIPEPEVIRLVKLLQRVGKKVSILTAAFPGCDIAKKEWIRRCGLETVPFIAVPYGESKSSYMAEPGVLLDDYTANLFDWENYHPENKGLKFRNRVNGTKGRWKGPSVSDCDTAEAMLAVITGM